MKYLFIFFILLFVLFAAFQLNDPDPGLWVTIYGIAAVASYMAWHKRLSWWVFAVLAVGYFVGALAQWPPEYHGIFFGEMQMRDMNIEMARESLGLAISGAVMALFTGLLRRP
jgi:mannose/fructose/N-acetylgalactosamine-specific phosphotransferase system component IIC